MTDDELIEHVAREWVNGGGDADGLAWCWANIQNKVKEIIAESEALGDD